MKVVTTLFLSMLAAVSMAQPPSRQYESTHDAWGGISGYHKIDLGEYTPFPAQAADRIEIPYTALDAQTARLLIYNLAGEVVRSYALKSQAGKVVLPSGSLLPGEYVYVLAVDGRLVSRKKLVIHS